MRLPIGMKLTPIEEVEKYEGMNPEQQVLGFSGNDADEEESDDESPSE